MNDARRTDAILSPDPTAWEQLVEKLPPEQQISAAAAARTGRGNPGEKIGPFMIGGTLLHTAVPTVEDVDSVRSKLVALRDAVLVVPTGHYSSTTAQEDNNPLIFDILAKDTGRSDRWDGWRLLPRWSVYSLTECPLAEVRSQQFIAGKYMGLYTRISSRSSSSGHSVRVLCRLF